MKSICMGSLGAQKCFALFRKYQKQEKVELKGNPMQTLLATSQEINLDL